MLDQSPRSEPPGDGTEGPRPPGEFDEPLDGTPIDGAPGPAVEGEPRIDLKRQTAVSILWTGAYTSSDYVLSFAVFAILARQLGPAAFGLYALAVAFAEFGKVLSSSGLVSALGRARHVTPEMADTVFWSTLALAGVVAGTLALVAPLLAAALGEPAVAPLLIALRCHFPDLRAGGDAHRADAA